MNQMDAAVEHLQIVIDMRPLDPVGALAKAEQRLRTLRAQINAR